MLFCPFRWQRPRAWVVSRLFCLMSAMMVIRGFGVACWLLGSVSLAWRLYPATLVARIICVCPVWNCCLSCSRVVVFLPEYSDTGMFFVCSCCLMVSSVSRNSRLMYIWLFVCSRWRMFWVMFCVLSRLAFCLYRSIWVRASCGFLWWFGRFSQLRKVVQVSSYCCFCVPVSVRGSGMSCCSGQLCICWGFVCWKGAFGWVRAFPILCASCFCCCLVFCLFCWYFCCSLGLVLFFPYHGVVAHW